MFPPLQQPLTNLPSLPDLLLTALSVCFLVSSLKPHKTTTRCPFPRRFLTMSFTVTTTKTSSKNNLNTLNSNLPPRCHTFTSPQSLFDRLKPCLPSDSFTSWGVKPGTKNVHNLWLKVSQGETSLADSTPPVRTVHVLLVRVSGKHGKILVESHQELFDGNVRKRGRPLSGKMRPNEDPESAAEEARREPCSSAVVEVVALRTLLPRSDFNSVHVGLSKS